MQPPPFVIVVGLLLAAGCLGGPGSTDSVASRRTGGAGLPALADASWAELAIPQGADHDHRDPKHHKNLSTPNFEVLGYEPLVTDYYGKTAGDYFCGATVEHGDRRLSVVHSWGSDVAFVLTDTTDLRNPKKIGELVMANTQVYDVTLTPDLRYVVMGTSPYDSGPDDLSRVAPLVRPYMGFRDACTGKETPLAGPEAGLPWGSGVVLVDISNPRNPFVADFRFFPVFGGHSVRAIDLDGRTYVLATVGNRVYAASYYVLMEIMTVAGTDRLSILSIMQDIGNGGEVHYADGLCCTHDGYLQKHPVTGESLAYLAYGPAGLVIFNIDDPEEPRFVSRWNDWDTYLGAAAPINAYVHEAVPIPETWDGRHYTFFGEECIARPPNTPTCIVFVADTTDPARPAFVGAWTLPIDVEWRTGLQFSTHYIAVQNRTLFVSAYHGGLWAIDVSSVEAMRAMRSVGVFIPSLESPKPVGGAPPRSAAGNYFLANYDVEATPTVLDLDPTSDGALVVFDTTSGLYTIRFDPTSPAPAPDPWPLQYNEA